MPVLDLLKYHLTWSSTLPSFCTKGSESICMSSPSPFCFSIREALDTLKMPWTLIRTLTFTLELSPSVWGTTFWTEKHPGGGGRQNCIIKLSQQTLNTHKCTKRYIVSLPISGSPYLIPTVCSGCWTPRGTRDK